MRADGNADWMFYKAQPLPTGGILSIGAGATNLYFFA